MYAVFFGTDRELVWDNAREYLDKNFSPAGTLNIITTDSYQSGQLSEILATQSLFGEPQGFVIDTPSEDKDFEKEVTDSLSLLSASSHTFIILETTLTAVTKKKYEKEAVLVKEFSASKKTPFNIFSLADALAEKNKKRLWLILQEARLLGMKEEELVGILWWQLKSLRLAKYTISAELAGMKEYPYNKAKRSLSNFTDGEIERLSVSLLSLYHSARAGEKEMDLALEQWILQL
jgi:DNA polymerase III delta subunit